MPQSNPMSTNTEHLDRIEDYIITYACHAPALESLIALRADMEALESNYEAQDAALTAIYTACGGKLEPGDTAANFDPQVVVRSVSALRASIAEMERQQVRLSLNERTVERLIGFAHSIGWDGVSNSKILDVFLEDYTRALIVERDQSRLTEEGAKRLLFTALRQKMDFEVRIASLEEALREIGSCPDGVSKTWPQIDELVRAALSSATKEPA